LNNKLNILKNGFASALQKLVRAGEQLLLVPFFVASWGPTYYGEWLTLTAIPTALALSDLGIGTAAANTFVLRYAGGDEEGAKRTAKAGFRFLLFICLGLILLSGILCMTPMIQKWMPHGTISPQDGLIVLCILLVSRALGFYFQLIEAFYRAAGKAALGMQLVSYYSIAKIIGSIAFLVCKGKAVELAVTDLIVTVLFLAVYAKMGFDLLPHFQWRKAIGIGPEFKFLIKKGVAYMISPAWQALFFQGTTLVVRASLGAEAVALFNTVRTLCRSINQLYSIINSAIFPELQIKLGQNDYESARKLYRTGIGVALATSVAGTLMLWLLGPWIYSIWTHGKLVPSQSLWFTFLIGILFNATWWTAVMVYRAANQPEKFAVAGILGSLISIAATWVLTRTIGMTGAAIGNTIMEVVMATYVIRSTARILNQNLVTLPSEMWNDFRDFFVYAKQIYKNRKNSKTTIEV